MRLGGQAHSGLGEDVDCHHADQAPSLKTREAEGRDKDTDRTFGEEREKSLGTKTSLIQLKRDEY